MEPIRSKSVRGCFLVVKWIESYASGDWKKETDVQEKDV